MPASEGTITIPAGCNITFTKGIVSSNSSAFLIVANTATVSGANDLSYVDGPIRKVGNQSFTFPIGQANNYQPATISAPGNNTHHFTAEYHYIDPSPSYDVLNKDVALNHISRNEYWIINRTNGASNVNVTLNWDNKSGGVDNLPQLRVARWDGTTWRDQGNGGTTGTTAAGTVVTSAPVSLWAATSPFSLSSSSGNNPLPITLLRFNAVPGNKQVFISWATANEKNSDHFELERSQNGIDFTLLTKLNGAGNSNTLLNYSWIDTDPLNGNSYYRLKDVDIDGDFTFSEVKSVHFDAKQSTSSLSAFMIYPNPSNGNYINLKMNEELMHHNSEILSLELYDMHGQKVYSSYNQLKNSGSDLNLRFNNALQPGVYSVTIITKTSVEKQLLVVDGSSSATAE